jgi:hypothetical protein
MSIPICMTEIDMKCKQSVVVVDGREFQVTEHTIRWTQKGYARRTKSPKYKNNGGLKTIPSIVEKAVEISMENGTPVNPPLVGTPPAESNDVFPYVGVFK